MARKSGKLAYNGNDKRFKGISEVIDKIAIQYNTLIDHFRDKASDENQTWSPSSVTYHTDKYPSPFTVSLVETADKEGGIDGVCDIYDTKHEGNIIDDRLFTTSPHINYISDNNTYYLDNCEFIPYVNKYSNRMHYPPYTKTPGLKLKISGLEANKPYTINIGSVYIHVDTSSYYYDSTLSLFDSTHTFGILLNSSQENVIGCDGNFEYLSPYDSSEIEYTSLLQFNEELVAGNDYPFFKGYHNNKPVQSQTVKLYGSYNFAGVYRPLQKSSGNSDSNNDNISITSYSNDEGNIYMFLSMEAVQQPCWVLISGLTVEGTGDIRKVRDAILETSAVGDNQYIVSNPGAEIFSGTSLPDPYLGKNGDMYVNCSETYDSSVAISENTATDACHIWELSYVNKTQNTYYINAVSNSNPSPDDIIYTVDQVDYIDEPYISFVLSNLNPNTTYHCPLNCRNLGADGDNFYDVLFLDGFPIPHTSVNTYAFTTVVVIKEFYFRAKGTSAVFKIPTTAIHLLTSEQHYTNPLVGNWDMTIKSVIPNALWFKSDYNWYSLGSGGGSQVIISPTISEGTKIADYRIDGVNGSLYSPYINIVPNPSSQVPPSQVLDTMTIGNQNYKVGSGSEVSFESYLSSGVIVGRLTINGVGYNIFAPEGGGSSKDSTTISEYSDMQSLNPVALNAPSSVTQFSSIQGLNYNLIPSMTSNTDPSGTASASTELDGNHAAWKAFDDKAGSYWLPTAADTAPYLEYEWTSEVTFTQMHIGVFNDGGTTVSRTITVEGLTSNDVWENCLSLGSFVNLEFRGGSYRRDYFVDLNGGNYKAIRITGNEAWYVYRSYACLIEDLSIF